MSLAHAILCAEPSAGRDGQPSGPAQALGDITERELIQRLRANDSTAFDLLYRTFHPRLMAIADSYVRSSVIAEELTQDTLLLAWNRRQEWRDDDNIIVYLYAVVRNRALKHLRHERIAGTVAAAAVIAEENLGNPSVQESVEDRVIRDDLVDAVTRSLYRLPEMQRTAFLLRWVHQMSYPEVAEVMQVSEVAVRKHVSRARVALIPIAAKMVG